MSKLQVLDFALAEVILYLDSYPESCEALDYYRLLLEKRESLATAYEKQCAPLTATGNGNFGEWRWVKSPWPWEASFPGNAGGRR